MYFNIKIHEYIMLLRFDSNHNYIHYHVLRKILHLSCHIAYKLILQLIMMKLMYD